MYAYYNTKILNVKSSRISRENNNPFNQLLGRRERPPGEAFPRGPVKFYETSRICLELSSLAEELGQAVVNQGSDGVLVVPAAVPYGVEDVAVLKVVAEYENIV